MPIISFIRQKWEQSWRYRRHIESFFRYPRLSRIVNFVKSETDYRLKREVATGLPYVMIIEPNNTCNLRCPLCPTPRGELAQPSGFMPLDRFSRLIDQIAPSAFRVILYNWGEPFLHREILPMIRYAHSRRIGMIVSSNLNVLPHEGVDALVESGLDQLLVSCDGLTQKTYETYRKNGSLDKVTHNLRQIRAARDRLGRRTPSLELQFIVFRHNEHEVPQVRSFARELGADHVSFLYPRFDYTTSEVQPATNQHFVRPGYESAESGSSPARPPRGPIACSWPWRSMVINWNGMVDPCCYNNTLQSFGNIFEQPLQEIWNNRFYRASRLRIRGSAYEPLGTICDQCRGFM